LSTTNPRVSIAAPRASGCCSLSVTPQPRGDHAKPHPHRRRHRRAGPATGPARALPSVQGRAHDATPATNPQIAAELFLTVAAVKTHLRSLCRAFGIDELPQQEKRRKLVALALAAGVVRDGDL
jgi:hypothetical protein